MFLRNLATLSMCGMAVCVTGLSLAQQPAAPRANPAQAGQQPAANPGQAGQRTSWMNTDQSLASCLAIANQEEITIAKFAEEKTRNDDVKSFAKMLQKDHQAFLQKLQRYAPDASREGYLTDESQPGATGQRVTSVRAPGVQVNVQPAGGQAPAETGRPIQQTAGTVPAGQVGAPIDFVQLHREIANECIRSAKEEMNKKDAGKFDECYIGHQIVKHQEMKTKLTVFERHATGELKQAIAEGLQTTEQHLKKAEDIMKQLDSHSSKRDSDSSKRNSDK